MSVPVRLLNAFVSKPESLRVFSAELDFGALIDDNAINLMVAKAMVTRAGFRAVTALNGLEAVINARSGDWAAILMDVMMPEMDGLEATREVRGLEGDAGRVTILGVTASAMPLERDACLEAGMNAVLTKPLSFEKLVAALGTAISEGTKPSL